MCQTKLDTFRVSNVCHRSRAKQARAPGEIHLFPVIQLSVTELHFTREQWQTAERELKKNKTETGKTTVAFLG